MEDKKTFGEFVTQKRKEAGLTQKGFAEKIFVTESAVSKWERGISFPDITLIRDICEVLQINEHELLTASEDLESRNIEKFARRYVKIIERFKKIVAFLYGISLVTCFICNLAINHRLSWFFIVMAGEMVAISISLLPILVSKNKGLVTLFSFICSVVLLLFVCDIATNGTWFLVSTVSFLFGMTVFFLPYVLSRIGLNEWIANNKALVCFCIDVVFLYLVLFVCELFTKGDWFITIGIPIASVGLLLPLGMLIIIRYTKINGFFKAAGCFGISAIFEFFFNGFISTVLGNHQYGYGFQADFRNWSGEQIGGNVNLIVFLSIIGMVLLFTLGGIIKSNENRK